MFWKTIALLYAVSFVLAVPPTCPVRPNTRCSSGGSRNPPVTRTGVSLGFNAARWMRQQNVGQFASEHHHYFVMDPDPHHVPSPGNIIFSWNDGGNGSGQDVELRPQIDWQRFVGAFEQIDNRQVTAFEIHFGLVFDGLENHYIWTNGHDAFNRDVAQDQGHYHWRAPVRRTFFRSSSDVNITQEYGLYQRSAFYNPHSQTPGIIKLKYSVSWTLKPLR